MEPDKLYEFLSDSDLVTLIERIKTSDDLLDVITLTENQHSDMLAWCMSPGEGHGQGDSVIKDFLEAAYHSSKMATDVNKKFFKKWTPGKIRTSSFGAAFVAREFMIENDKGKNRLDIFLVDPQNKILVAIENKAGASLTKTQLSRYFDAVKIKFYKTFDLAFVVLDKYSNEKRIETDKRWSFLDYGWLKASSERARHQLDRNNNAAQMLMAYCQKQTDWESPTERLISELAAKLSFSHESVIQALRKIRKKSLLDWKPNEVNDPLGELTLFYMQQPQVCAHILDAQSIATIVHQLMRAIPELSEVQTEIAKTWFNVAPVAVHRLMRTTDDADWPVYINVFRETPDSPVDGPKFTLRLFWVRNDFNPVCCDEPGVRQHFCLSYPALGTFSDANIRKLVVKEHISSADVKRYTMELFNTVSQLIQSAPLKGH